MDFDLALERLLSRIEELGAITDTPGSLTRTFLSPANLRAARQVMAWMEEAGMKTGHDAGGTIRGVLPGKDPPLPPLLLGSHLDTVIDAGKYDGALGVLIALAALEVTGPLDFPVHVLGFSDEEGVRFHATYLGSRACVGQLGPEMLEIRDRAGITLGEALANEGWHEGATSFFYENHRSKGYVEIHIEQGRVLDELKEAVCAVSAICGQRRLTITLRGKADHAGTTPMPLRHDALAGAAECILEVESHAIYREGLLATVGKIDVRPGASNTIPGEATFTLDFRHPDDAARERLLDGLLERFRVIATRRKLQLSWDPVQSNAAVPCDTALTRSLLDAVEKQVRARFTLPSGAGHDAVMMATVMPVAMLFVRCRGGLSHHPEEYAGPRDIAVALRVLVDFLSSLR
ncbi:M20 family metallo-hydrolase [Luteolibacter arcticus]|uniref:M20 family metallo-hydrolase n=1 Tax=Luteolibacter arcticus TaxID=1581411 RepID=A0ABT3GF89_9BACT|nr:M20 family metallo-hydrolase [Luteolibacter arcticus]MCW1922283.1 M20 family metallo-hydrolase [Luteolibacter arcticus]